MKRVSFVFVGALIFLALGMLITHTFSAWYAKHYIQSDDDMNHIGKIIFLALYPSFFVTGGWFADMLYKKTVRRNNH